MKLSGGARVLRGAEPKLGRLRAGPHARSDPSRLYGQRTNPSSIDTAHARGEGLVVLCYDCYHFIWEGDGPMGCHQPGAYAI
jgi:hypothetical protein